MMTFYTKNKKLICFIIVTCMLLGLSACGKGKGGVNTGTDAADNGETKNSVFAADLDFKPDIPKDYSLERMEATNGRIYYVMSKYLDSSASEGDAGYDGDMSDMSDNSMDASTGDASEDYPQEYAVEEMDTATTDYKILYTDLDGNNPKELEVPEATGDYYYDTIYVSPSGRICISLCVSYMKDDEYGRNIYFLYYDKDGNFEKKTDVTEIIDGNEEEVVEKALLDNDGNLIVFTDAHIYIYDTDGKEINKVEFKGNVSQAAFTGDGRIIINNRDEFEYDDIKLNIVDAKTGELSEFYDIPNIEYFYGSDCLMNGNDDVDFYYRSDKGIFAYDLETGEAAKAVDYNASDINESLVYRFIFTDKDTLIMLQNRPDYSGNDVVKYRKVDPENVKEKKHITLMTYNASEGLKSKAIDFNKRNNEYRIDIVDYSEEEDPEAAMSTDIAAGKIPDIYDISRGIGKMSVSQAVEKGLLENLKPYLDSDPDINADDFLPNIIKASMIGDGIYTLSSEFSVISLGAKKSDIGGLDGWNFMEMKEYVDSKEDDVQLLDYSDKESLLELFLTADIDDFVDWQTGECHFDTDEFKALLEICNRGDKEINYEEDVSSAKLIQEGKQLFKELNITGYDIQIDNMIFKNDLAYVGFPTQDKNGTFVSFSDLFGISAESEYKDACWAFLRELLTYDYQSEAVSKEIIYFIPTRKDVFEEYLRKYTTTEVYEDNYGKKIYPLEGETGYGEISLTLKPFSKKEEAQFRDIISRADKTVYYNKYLTAIVQEEATHYFNGDKSVDETAELIQNRLTIYINESR